MEQTELSDEELENFNATLNDPAETTTVYFNDKSSDFARQSDNNSTKKKSFEEGSQLRPSNNSSHESINFPETPRKDVDESDAADIIVDNLNQENFQTIHPLDGSGEEIENLNTVEDQGMLIENFREENVREIRSPEEKENKFSNVDLQGLSIHTDDQNLDFQSSFSLGSSQKDTETGNHANAVQDFQDSEMLNEDLNQENNEAVQEQVTHNEEIPNIQDELHLTLPINSDSQDINFAPAEEHSTSLDGCKESPLNKNETYQESNVIEAHNAEQENGHLEFPFELQKTSDDQIVSSSNTSENEFSLEIKGSPKNHVVTNYDTSETCISTMSDENNEIQGIEHRINEPKNEFDKEFQVGSLEMQENTSTQLENVNHQEGNIDKHVSGPLEASEGKDTELENDLDEDTFVDPLEVPKGADTKQKNDFDEDTFVDPVEVPEGADTKQKNDLDEDTFVDPLEVPEGADTKQKNDLDEIFIGPLLNSSDFEVNDQTSLHEDLSLVETFDNKVSNHDLNIQGHEELNENNKNLVTIPLNGDDNKKPETKLQEFQLESPNYNNDYDPDIPGSEIIVKNVKEENGSPGELSENEKFKEADTNNDRNVSEVSMPQEASLDLQKLSEIGNVTLKKENPINSPAALQENSEEQQRDEPKKKTSVRSLITRALENSPDVIVQRSGAKIVEDKPDKGAEEKTSKPYFQNLAPYANDAKGPPCSMAATISGLILPRV